MSGRRGEFHIGTSGWSYDHWEEILYPPKTNSARRMDYYVERYATVEVNSTYYRWPRESTFEGWAKRLPSGFAMTVKAPKWFSHYDPLGDPEGDLARMAPGLTALGKHRGVLLVQTPERFACDLAKLDAFGRAVPAWLKAAVELRHPSWDIPETYAILERHGIGYCVISGAKLPCILRATAPFVYVRFHGPDPEHLYAGSYSDQDLIWWRDRIREWLGQGRDVFGYFNNDGYGYALENADRLIALLREP